MEAIEFAIKMEQDGRRFYTAAAGRVSDAAAQRMLRSLAADEARHEAILQGIRAGKPEMVTGTNFADIRTVFEELRQEKRPIQAETTLDEALAEGIEAERRSIELYREMAGNAANETERNLLHRLQLEEEKHENLLNVTREYLAEPHLVLETSEFLFYDYDGSV